MTPTRFLDLPGGQRIAFRHTPGAGPTLVFLPGYMSDMTGSKASAVFDWATSQGRACLLLDYSGCGQSLGDFADGTLIRWRDEVLAVVAAQCPGKVVFIGSSMGAWLMLLAGLSMPDRLAGLIGIAAAPDFTDWSYSAEEKAEICEMGVYLRPLSDDHDGETMPIWQGFWQSGQDNMLLDRTIAIDCPVRLLHGQQDADVPWRNALRLAAALRSEDVQVTLVKDGDHRLSREADLALLLRTIAALA